MTGKQGQGRTAAGLAVGRYLDCLADAALDGGQVMLGIIAGMPRATDDPDVVDQAIAYHERRYRERSGTLARLKARERILELQRAAANLRSNGNAELRAGFVKYAAEYAAQHGISYAAFRAEGVPAAVLKEAGIEP